MYLRGRNDDCISDWNELFTTKCFACGFPIEAGDRWVEALNNNYHSPCFNCTVSWIQRFAFESVKVREEFEPTLGDTLAPSPEICIAGSGADSGNQVCCRW